MFFVLQSHTLTYQNSWGRKYRQLRCAFGWFATLSGTDSVMRASLLCQHPFVTERGRFDNPWRLVDRGNRCQDSLLCATVRDDAVAGASAGCPDHKIGYVAHG